LKSETGVPALNPPRASVRIANHIGAKPRACLGGHARLLCTALNGARLLCTALNGVGRIQQNFVPILRSSSESEQTAIHPSVATRLLHYRCSRRKFGIERNCRCRCHETGDTTRLFEGEPRTKMHGAVVAVRKSHRQIRTQKKEIDPTPLWKLWKTVATIALVCKRLSAVTCLP
jgi:hypothetical protein